MKKASNTHWSNETLLKFLTEYFKDKEVKTCNRKFVNFLILQSKLEKKLIEITNQKKFKRIFTNEIMAKIHAETNESTDDIREKLYYDGDYNINDFLKSFKRSTSDFSGKAWKSRLSKIQDRGCLRVPLYALATGLSYEDAVRSLAKVLGLEYKDFKDVSIPKNPGCDLVARIEYHFEDENNQEYFTVGNFSMTGQKVLLPVTSSYPPFIPPDIMPLLNLSFVEYNSQSDIFLTDSIPLSDILHNEYLSYFRKKRLEEGKQFWDRERDEYIRAKHRASDITSGRLGSLIGKCEEIINKINELTEIKYYTNSSNIYQYTDLVWSSWWGNFDYLDQIDWSPLKGRNIYYVQYGEQDEKTLFDNLLALYVSLRKLEATTIKFIYVPSIVDVQNPECNHIKIMSPDDLLYEAFISGVTKIPEVLKEEATEVINKRLTKTRDRFLIDPIISRQALIILTAKTGVGKSWQALTLAYALATKGKLFNGWKVKHTCKVLYICDEELDHDTRKERCKILSKMYDYDEKTGNLTIQPVSGFDLNQETYQKRVEKYLHDCQISGGSNGQPVKLLILDHLTKLAHRATQQENWVKLRPWFKKLKEKDISVLLVHHLNSIGEIHGSQFIENDATVHIHLNKIIHQKNLIIDVIVSKNTRAKDQPVPCRIQLINGRKKALWKEIKNPELELKWKIDNNEKIEKIRELKINKEMTWPQIADAFGVSLSTIEKYYQKNRESIFS